MNLPDVADAAWMPAWEWNWYMIVAGATSMQIVENLKKLKISKSLVSHLETDFSFLKKKWHTCRNLRSKFGIQMGSVRPYSIRLFWVFLQIYFLSHRLNRMRSRALNELVTQSWTLLKSHISLLFNINDWKIEPFNFLVIS